MGYIDAGEKVKKNPLPIGKWFKAKIRQLTGGNFRVEIPQALKDLRLPYDMTSKRR